MEKRYFTPAEANELLPAVQKQLAALQQLKSQLERKFTELRTMKLLHGHSALPADNDPYFKIECELEFLQFQFQNAMESFEKMGCQLKDIDTGLVDFPAVMNGEEVLLCWRQGEARIDHYHGLYDGFGGRRPLQE